MRQSGVPRKRTFIQSILLLGVILIVAYGGASYYAGMLAQQEIRHYVQMPSSAGSVQARLIEHRAGVWQSRGVLALESSGASKTQRSLGPGEFDKDAPRASARTGTPGDSPMPAGSGASSVDSHTVATLDLTQEKTPHTPRSEEHETPVLIIQYEINHTLWPTRLASVSWTARIHEATATSWQSNMSPALHLTGVGMLNWQRGFESSLSSAPFVIRADNSQIDISAMTGQLVLDHQRLQIQAHWPFVQGQGPHPDLRIDALALQVDTSDRFAGLGTSTIQMGKIQWRSITASQVTMSGQSTRVLQAIDKESGRINLDLQARAQHLTLPGYELRAVVLDGALRDLDLQMIHALQRIWNETAGLQLLTPTDLVRWRQALRTLVLQGMSVELREVSAQTSLGQASAQAVLELQSVDQADRNDPGKPIDFEKYLQSRGELRILGQGVSPALTTLGLLTGFLTRTDQGVGATYELSPGGLQINNKVLPAEPVFLLLNRFLNKLVVIGPDR